MKNMRITYNQIEILEIIHSFRYMPLKVLVIIAKKEKLYAFRQNISRIINKLEERGYVKSFYYGNNWKVVYLTRLGADILASAKGVCAKDIRVANSGVKVQFAMLEHTVKIAELYEQFLAELPNFPDYKLFEWNGDQKSLYHYSFRSNKSGKTIKRILSPDSYFKIQKDSSILEYLLEYDTGRMDKEQLSKKFMRYFEFFAYGDWKKQFQEFPSILFLTDRTEEQVQNLLEKDKFTFDEGLKNRMLFGKSQNVLLRGIGISENVRSVPSEKIKDYLKNEFVFAYTNKRWAKQLLNKLASG